MWHCLYQESNLYYWSRCIYSKLLFLFLIQFPTTECMSSSFCSHFCLFFINATLSLFINLWFLFLLCYICLIFFERAWSYKVPAFYQSLWRRVRIIKNLKMQFLNSKFLLTLIKIQLLFVYFLFFICTNSTRLHYLFQT